MASRAINTILNLRDNFSNTINRVSENTKKFQRQIKLAETQAARMREGISGAFSSTAMKVAGAVGILGLGEFAKESIKLASDLTEVQNVVDTTFGDMSSTINDFATNAGTQFGMSELNAKKFTGTIGAMLKSAGFTGNELTDMSTGLVGLAGDLSSFYNLTNEEAFDKLKSGISGESEPLKALGVDISDTTTAAYALANGFSKSWKDATTAEKELWRYKSILNQTKDAQGDFAKTSTSFANQMRIAKMNMQQFGSSIAVYVLPALSELMQGFNNFITSINVSDVMDNKVIPAINNVRSVVDVLKQHLDILIPVLSGVVSGFIAFMAIGKVLDIIKSFGTVTKVIGMLVSPIGLVCIAIAALVAGFVYAYEHSESFRQSVNNIANQLMEFGSNIASSVLPVLQQLGQWISTNILPVLEQMGQWIMGTLVPALIQFGQHIASSILPVLQQLGDFFMSNILPVIQQVAEKVGSYLLPIFQQMGSWFVSTLLPCLSSIFDAFMALWNNVLIPIGEFLINNFLTQFKFVFDLLAPIVNGVIGVIGEYINALIEEFKGIADFITGVFTGDWSKAWEGIKEIFKGIWDGFKAIALAPIKLIKDAIDGLMTAIGNLFDSWNKKSFDSKEVKVTGSAIAGETGTAMTAGLDTMNSQITTDGTNATGTQYWKGGRTWVGEHGPEIVDLPSGSKVHTNSQSQKMVGSNGGHTFIINFNGNVGTEEFFNQAGQHIFNQVQLALINK